MQHDEDIHLRNLFLYYLYLSTLQVYSGFFFMSNNNNNFKKEPIKIILNKKRLTINTHHLNYLVQFHKRKTTMKLIIGINYSVFNNKNLKFNFYYKIKTTGRKKTFLFTI